MKKNIIYLHNNKVGFVGISPEYSNNINLIIEKDIPKNCNYIIIDGDVDIDPIFTGAIVGKMSQTNEVVLDYDLDKVKNIWIDLYREARTPILEKLDIDFMKTVETNDEAKKSEIVAAKQALRDVTSIDLPDDLAGIKATWPEILGSNPFA